MTEKIAVFDTNVLPGPVSVDGPFWQSIFRLCEISEHVASIPEIVVHESVNWVRQKLDEHAEALLSAHRKLSALTLVEPVYIPSGEAEAEAWEARLREQFDVIPLRGEDATEALVREALRKPPAREGRGSRDSSIWLSAMSRSIEGAHVKLVSRNTSDFGHKKGGLHPQLAAEVKEKRVELNYYSSLDDFVSALATRDDTPNLNLNSSPEILREAVLGSLPDDAEVRVEEITEVSVLDEATSIDRAYKVDLAGLALVQGSVKLEVEGKRPVVEFQAWATYEAGSGELNSMEITSIEAPSDGDV